MNIVKFDVAKVWYYVTIIVTAVGLSFAFGLYHGAKRTDVLWWAVDLKNHVR
jgi:hypothetical protein